MIIIDGPAGNGMGKAIAPSLGSEYLQCKHRLFPDGESEVEIERPVEGEDVLIVQTMYPSQDKRVVELLLLASTARKNGARSVGAIVPYLAYAREDKKFSGKSNAVSINAVLELLNFAGITTLVTVAPHKAEPLCAFNGDVKIPDAITPLAHEVKKHVSNSIVLAPDKGALDIARQFAGIVGCEYTYIDKRRDQITGNVEIVKAPDMNMEGKEVIIADDMISSGSTIEMAAKFARENGANKIIVAAVHLLMADGAHDRISDAGVSEIYGTNTVPYSRAHVVDVSDAIAKAVNYNKIRM